MPRLHLRKGGKAVETLIEMFDQRPVENILATEVFRPARTVFLCPPEVAEQREAERRIREYIRHRGIQTQLEFLTVGRYDADAIRQALKKVAHRYQGCVLDVTGGSDAALFASGMVCAETGLPAFTFSRKTKRFYNIQNAPFAGDLPCEVVFQIEDYFKMAGGDMRPGRINREALQKYSTKIPAFFEIYLNHKRDWQQLVAYMQRASYTPKNTSVSLNVRAPFTVKGERGIVSAPVALLTALADLGFLLHLQILGNTEVRFSFPDSEVRTWLRDVGAVLELYVYQTCVNLGVFDDVRASVVVDWENGEKRDAVTNEIDVMTSKGIIPLFISCKTNRLTTEALNELAILRDRFGGKLSRAAIVTTQYCRAVTRHRADQLDITVIDIDDLKAGRLGELLSPRR